MAFHQSALDGARAYGVDTSTFHGRPENSPQRAPPSSRGVFWQSKTPTRGSEGSQVRGSAVWTGRSHWRARACGLQRCRMCSHPAHSALQARLLENAEPPKGWNAPGRRRVLCQKDTQNRTETLYTMLRNLIFWFLLPRSL